MEILYAILLCLTQLELMAALTLWAFSGRRGEKRGGEPSPAPEDGELEKAWRDTLSQLMGYSIETAQRAAREDDR